MARKLLDGTLSEPWILVQNRICYTELAEAEFPTHSTVFGPFALQYSVTQLRRMGAIPAIYVPVAREGLTSMEGLRAALMARLGEVQLVLTRLAEMQSFVNATSNKAQLVTLTKNGSPIGVNECTVAALQDLLTAVQFDARPYHELNGAIKGLANYFVPTENLSGRGPLGTPLTYYRQREWRIVAGMELKGQSVTRQPTASEAEEILKIDPRYFGEELSLPSGRERRVDACQVMMVVAGAHPLVLASRVLVPGDVVDEAKRILSFLPDPPSVAAHPV